MHMFWCPVGMTGSFGYTSLAIQHAATDSPTCIAFLHLVATLATYVQSRIKFQSAIFDCTSPAFQQDHLFDVAVYLCM
jgi:hypothetical protein